MSSREFKTLAEITPEELERLTQLAQQRGPGVWADSWLLGMAAFTMLGLGLFFYFVPLGTFELTLVNLTVLSGLIALVAGLVWYWIYRKTEHPRDMARKQLHALREEMRAREASQQKAH